MLITEMLARNTRLYGDEVALVEREPAANKRSEITWLEFYHLSNRIANTLIARGIRKGDRVVLLMMNSLEWLPIYFGILRSGAIAVPLNFRFDADDIHRCIELAEAKAVIFGEEFIDRITRAKSSLTSLVETFIFVGESVRRPEYAEGYPDVLAGTPTEEPDVPLDLMDGAGIYFTSGTTGRPKGVFLQHRQLKTVIPWPTAALVSF